jgi:hypothetical protein
LAAAEADWSATPATVRALVQEQAQRFARWKERLPALEAREKQTSEAKHNERGTV